MKTETFNIINLDCAHCASVIEDNINKLDTIEDINLNFINKTLKINF